MSNIKLLNGDSYKLIKDIPDKSVDLIYVDIPYLIASGGTSDTPLAQRIVKEQHQLGNKSAKKNINKKLEEYKQNMINAKSKDEYEKWHIKHSSLMNMMNLKSIDIVSGIDYKILDEFVRISKYIYIYIWCSKEQILDLMKFFIDKHNCNFNILTWCKTNCVPATNNNWLPNIEYCLVFKQKGAPRYNDGYELKSKWYISSQNKSDKELYKHPTIKPLELVKQHIKHSTNEGDTVLDCFMGSGTTGVACKELNRNFIGIELDDEYFKIAKDRINGITADGQLSIFTDVEKMEQGSLFDD